MSSMMEEEIGERYRHLLQPLRDVNVSENWTMSLKAHLDDYLEKLKHDRERNRVREDGEIIKFNFSEAAMLLQGSLAIFSRKVDHLHEAITEAYMGISKKKKKANATDTALNETANEDGVGRIKNDFDLLDEKAKMLGELVDTRWLIQNDRRREPRDAVRVGTRRDVGKRDRFVDLPISFIPTKKSAPSLHHFRFEQNNEQIYIPQSDLFSFNAIAYSNDEGTDMTVFMNSAYLQLVHSFTSEYIPYLRDEHNNRLQRIGAPYGIDAPSEVYQRFLELDERENRGNESQAFLATFYGGDDGGNTPEPENMVDLTQELNFNDVPRPSSVEAARESVVPNRFTDELTDPRVSNLPNIDQTEVPVDATLASAADFGRSLRSTNLNSSFASSVNHAAEPVLDVDIELAFMDEYANVKPKLRVDTSGKENKRKRQGPRRAIELCRIRDEQLREKFAEQGKDYEKYKNNLAEYITANLFSRKLCIFGSVLENINPSLRKNEFQALNRIFYTYEKHIKSVKQQRKAEQLEKERKIRMEEKRKRREHEKFKQYEKNAKKRRTQQIVENDENAPSTSESAPQNGQDSDDDYFGAQPDDDDLFNERDEIDEIEQEFNPAVLMEQEINQLAGNAYTDDEDDSFSEVNIFGSQDANANLETVYPLGDNPDHQITNTSAMWPELDLGSFSSNDPAFFDLDKLADFFSKVRSSMVSDDQLLIQSIQNFWTDINERDMCLPAQQLQKWSAHVFERLDEDAKRKPFEIHDYGSEVLNAFGENGIGTILKFRKIVKNVQKYEISRYLLATLILANCGNVEVINDGKEWDGVGKPVINKRTSLRLKSLERHHEVFQSEQLLITS